MQAGGTGQGRGTVVVAADSTLFPSEGAVPPSTGDTVHTVGGATSHTGDTATGAATTGIGTAPATTPATTPEGAGN